jgi:hypothetical protein
VAANSRLIGPALGVAEQVGVLDPGVVHHGPEVVDPFVEVGDPAVAVGAARAALVEVEVAAERREPFQHRADRRLLPGQLDVLRGRRDGDHGVLAAPNTW